MPFQCYHWLRPAKDAIVQATIWKFIIALIFSWPSSDQPTYVSEMAGQNFTGSTGTSKFISCELWWHSRLRLYPFSALIKNQVEHEAPEKLPSCFSYCVEQATSQLEVSYPPSLCKLIPPVWMGLCYFTPSPLKLVYLFLSSFAFLSFTNTSHNYLSHLICSLSHINDCTFTLDCTSSHYYLLLCYSQERPDALLHLKNKWR